MSIQFGRAVPPHLSHPATFFFGVMLGLAVIVASTYFADRLGTAMFKRGFAKPFYIKGHRIHHSCIYFMIPATYGILVGLFFLGYVQPVWSSLWVRISDAASLAAIALAIDFLGDRFWPRIRMDVILHHEWIYTLIPAYILTYVVNIVI
ncbi:MAG: hypothetical protein ACYC7D_07200 [Nitrososphaerales archaeon]